MTLNQQLESFSQKIKEHKYVLINCIFILGIGLLCLLLASRAVFDSLFSNRIEGMWLVHLGIFNALTISFFVTIIILIYGLFIDRTALDRKLNIYNPSYWKAVVYELIENRRFILFNVLQTIGLVIAQGLLTVVIAFSFKLDIISVMFYQLVITVLFFNITPTRTLSVNRSFMFNRFNLSTFIYLLILIMLAVKLYT